MSDWSNFGAWTEWGSLTATQRANGIWKKVLSELEKPPMDVAVFDEIQAFVERCTGEGGSPVDS